MQTATTPIFGMIQAMTSAALEKPRAAERDGGGPRFVAPPRPSAFRR